MVPKCRVNSPEYPNLLGLRANAVAVKDGNRRGLAKVVERTERDRSIDGGAFAGFDAVFHGHEPSTPVVSEVGDTLIRGVGVGVKDHAGQVVVAAAAVVVFVRRGFELVVGRARPGGVGVGGPGVVGADPLADDPVPRVIHRPVDSARRGREIEAIHFS